MPCHLGEQLASKFIQSVAVTRVCTTADTRLLMQMTGGCPHLLDKWGFQHGSLLYQAHELDSSPAAHGWHAVTLARLCTLTIRSYPIMFAIFIVKSNSYVPSTLKGKPLHKHMDIRRRETPWGKDLLTVCPSLRQGKGGKTWSSCCLLDSEWWGPLSLTQEPRVFRQHLWACGRTIFEPTNMVKTSNSFYTA